LYSELMSISLHLSLFTIDVIDSGRISSGTREPITDSRLITYLTPSTCSISFIMERTSLDGTEVSTRSMCVEAMLSFPKLGIGNYILNILRQTFPHIIIDFTVCFAVTVICRCDKKRKNYKKQGKYFYYAFCCLFHVGN